MGASSFSYDNCGNMTSDGGSDSYTYNANNLMTSATQSGVTTNLTYDAENRLLSVAKNGTTTKFLYDGTDSLVDYDGSGNVLRVYVHGPGDDEPLLSYDVTNGWAKSYLHADDNGSIDLITHDGGGQAQINTYDAYGLPGSGNTGRFQYTGQAWVPEIGMYYYKARLYNPVIGRFMQTDPIGYGDGMNWYNYVHGDPVNGIDPTGTQGMCPPDCGVIIANGPAATPHNDCPDGASCLSGEEACSMYHCGQDPGGMPTAGQLVNRFLFSPPLTIAYIGDMQTCPSSSSGKANATTHVHEPNGTSVDLPASADGQSLKYVSGGFDAAEIVGGGASGGTFRYNAANGNIIQGTYGSYNVAIGAGASVSASGGLSGGTDQFFGRTINFNLSGGPLSGGVGHNAGGYNGHGSGSPSKWGGSATLSYSNTFPIGEVKSIGCWTKK